MILEQINARLAELGFTEKVEFANNEVAETFLRTISMPGVTGVRATNRQFEVVFDEIW